MNKSEAIAALNEGRKITHNYFSPQEWIMLDGKEIVYENGSRISEKEFWKILENSLVWDNNWFLFDLPMILESPDMIVSTYAYRKNFIFQRMLKDQKWYVTHKNYIIAHSQFRNDLEEWIDITYFKDANKRVPRNTDMPEIPPPPLF